MGVQGEAYQRAKDRGIATRQSRGGLGTRPSGTYAMALQGCCLLQFFGDGPIEEAVRVDELETFLKERIPESFVLRGELGVTSIRRSDWAEQESRWIESVMGALTAQIE